MSHLHSYPSVFAIGHKSIDGIFDKPVTVEEKVDGSQFSFGVFGGDLLMRSKGVDILPAADPGMFAAAVAAARAVAHVVRPDAIYRCEFLQKPKHNTLCYDRVPLNNLVVFDVELDGQRFLEHADKADEADRIGFEAAPLLHEGMVESLDQLLGLLDRVSFLGGCKIEGFVVKNYDLITPDKKVAVGKFVSEKFKEVHRGDWRERNPTRGDVVERLIAEYRTPARWAKAVQHLRDRGELLGDPRDIGPLLNEVGVDVLAEDSEAIAKALLAWAWPKIRRGITSGLPDWYKTELAASAFEVGG